jgi:hypothetical protein
VHPGKSKRVGGTRGRLAVDGGIAEPRVNDDPAEGKKREAPTDYDRCSRFVATQTSRHRSPNGERSLEQTHFGSMTIIMGVRAAGASVFALHCRALQRGKESSNEEVDHW